MAKVNFKDQLTHMNCRYLANKLLPYFRFDPKQFVSSLLSTSRSPSVAILTWNGGSAGQSCDILVDSGICVFQMPDLTFTEAGPDIPSLVFNLPNGFEVDCDSGFFGTLERTVGIVLNSGVISACHLRVNVFTVSQVQLQWYSSTGGSLGGGVTTLYSAQIFVPVKRAFL